jgi:hypothetical protein
MPNEKAKKIVAVVQMPLFSIPISPYNRSGALCAFTHDLPISFDSVPLTLLSEIQGPLCLGLGANDSAYTVFERLYRQLAPERKTSTA